MGITYNSDEYQRGPTQFNIAKYKWVHSQFKQYLVKSNMVGHIAIKEEVPLSWEALLTCNIHMYIGLKGRGTFVLGGTVNH